MIHRTILFKHLHTAALAEGPAHLLGRHLAARPAAAAGHAPPLEPALLHRAAPHPTPLAPLKSPSRAAPSPASISSVAGAVVPPQPIADAELENRHLTNQASGGCYSRPEMAGFRLFGYDPG